MLPHIKQISNTISGMCTALLKLISHTLVYWEAYVMNHSAYQKGCGNVYPPLKHAVQTKI